MQLMTGMHRVGLSLHHLLLLCELCVHASEYTAQPRDRPLVVKRSQAMPWEKQVEVVDTSCAVWAVLPVR